MVQNGGSRKSFWEALATGKLLWMISLRSMRPCESGCSRWAYLVVFLGTWRTKVRPTQVPTWMAFSWFTSSHSTAVSSAWIQYVLPGLMSRHKNHHGLVLKDMWHLSFRFPLRLYGKWTIVCKLALLIKSSHIVHYYFQSRLSCFHLPLMRFWFFGYESVWGAWKAFETSPLSVSGKTLMLSSLLKIEAYGCESQEICCLVCALRCLFQMHNITIQYSQLST